MVNFPFFPSFSGITLCFDISSHPLYVFDLLVNVLEKISIQDTLVYLNSVLSFSSLLVSSNLINLNGIFLCILTLWGSDPKTQISTLDKDTQVFSKRKVTLRRTESRLQRLVGQSGILYRIEPGFKDENRQVLESLIFDALVSRQQDNFTDSVCTLLVLALSTQLKRTPNAFEGEDFSIRSARYPFSNGKTHIVNRNLKGVSKIEQQSVVFIWAKKRKSTFE